MPLRDIGVTDRLTRDACAYILVHGRVFCTFIIVIFEEGLLSVRVFRYSLHFTHMAAMQIARYESKEDADDALEAEKSDAQNLKPIVRKDVRGFKLDDVSAVEVIDRGNYVEVPSSLDPKDKDVISCLCISDTHGQHHGIEEAFSELPSADILIHSGDFTNIGHWGDIKSYDAWVKKLLAANKFQHCLSEFFHLHFFLNFLHQCILLNLSL